jgi:hypothetical protein
MKSYAHHKRDHNFFVISIYSIITRECSKKDEINIKENRDMCLLIIIKLQLRCAEFCRVQLMNGGMMY